MDEIRQIGEVVSAWEDINPPMASAPRHEQRSLSSALQPATSDQFRDELTACLALVVPVGMTEEARREWLAVAWGTLRHLPADVLAAGCQTARNTCDHPSKIVPTILATVEQQMRWRKDAARRGQVALPPPTPRNVMDRRGEAMTQEDTDELNAILEGLGATVRYRTDGTRYQVEAA